MSFRLGKIPIQIHGSFLLVTLLLGASTADPRRIAIWFVVVLVSVLIHELGHALVGRAFGLAPRIDLHGMGGTTSWTDEGRDGAKIGHARSIAISLAGPFAGFAFGLAIVIASRFGAAPAHPLVKLAISDLMWVNFGWGVFNLVPLLPLDGGNVMRATLHALTKGRGERPARIVSIAVAGLIALFGLSRQWWWVGMLGVMFAMQNVQALSRAGKDQFDKVLSEAIAAADEALERQDGAAAMRALLPAMSDEASPALRQMAVRQLAYAFLLEQRWHDLVALLERDHALVAPEELERYAGAARELGRPGEAERIEALKGPPVLTDFKSST